MKHEIDSKGNSTGTKLQHLQSVANMTKKKPKELEFEEPHKDVIHLIGCFNDIKKTSGVKITYNELKCYQDVMSVNLCSWQVKAIMQIDNIYEGAVNG